LRSAAVVRVAIDVAAVPSLKTGVGRYLEGLLGGLQELGAPHEFLLLSRRQGPDPFGAVPFKRVPYASSNRVLRILQERYVLPRVLHSVGAEVFHGPHYSLPKKWRGPSVVTVHDLSFVQHPEWHQATKVRYFTRAMADSFERADVIICVSDRTRAALLGWFGYRDGVVTIPHGVGSPFVADEPEEGFDAAVLSRLGVPEGFLLFVGTKEPRKNLLGLIRAVESLGRQRPEVPPLVLVGRRGWKSWRLRMAIASNPRVLDLGYVRDEYLAVLYRRALAVVYPAFLEGFGLPALEVLSCGGLLVTSRDTTMAEVAGRAAVLVDATSLESLKEGIEAAISMPAVERAWRRAEGLKVASRYTWGRCAAGHVAAYERALYGP
jgi:glycosyltransferase involved in cell wall biosynthesis